MKKIVSLIIMVFIMGALSMSSSAITDAGGDFSVAKSINTNTLCTDSISSSGDVDIFRFDVKVSGLISVEFFHNIIFDSAEVWKGILYNQYGEELYSYSFVGNKTNDTTCEIGLEKGVYFLRFSASSRINLWDNVHVYDSSEYSFKIKFSQNDNVEKELNNSFNTATRIEQYRYNKGSLKDKGDCDFYKFEITVTGNYYIDFSHKLIVESGDSEYFEIRLYDFAGKEIKYISSLGNKEKTKEIVYLEKGTYYIRIGGGLSYGGHLASQKYTDSTYTLCVYDYVDTSIIKDSKTTADTITIIWKDFSNVSGYYIYQYNTKTKIYEQIANLKDKNRLEIKGLSKGKTYKFKVRAYKTVNGNTFWGEFSPAYETATKPDTTKKISSTQTESTITLKWNKVAGATGYRIYKYNDKSKKYEKVKTTSSRSYKIKKLKSGKIYKFKIKAYIKTNNATIWGNETKVLSSSTKPATVTLSKLTAGSKQLTATWKTVSGATGYEVVYSTSKKFTKKTTKTVTIKKAKTKKTTVKKLKKGKKYYVKVRAYKTVSGKKIYGAYSSVKSVKVK